MINNRAGQLIKQLSGDRTYYSFSPTKLCTNFEIVFDDEIDDLRIKAHKSLAILDDRSRRIPNIDLFMSMYVQKEALLSSQIEGTQATLENMFDPNVDKNINIDVEEVINYVKATKYSLNRLEELSICNRLLLETHKVLLSGLRGKEKSPGKFRRSQNWIGGYGSNLKTASYIPPDVETMKECLYDLEKFINEESNMDELIKTALIHYQFETIHPFLDGNGRIGRLLIILYLLNKNIIRTPTLYISYYLKLNRIEYYDRMSEIRRSGNYEQWIKFFLKAIIISCESALETSDKLIKLNETNKIKIDDLSLNKGSKDNLNKLLSYIEAHPIIEIKNTSLDLDLSYNTVNSMINKFIELGILVQNNDSQRNKTFIYKEYVDILKDGTEI